MFFQAARMDGNIGFYNILPDQFPVIETIITLPLFAFISSVVFPLCNIMKKALNKVILGGSLVGVSLVGAGIVSLIMEGGYPELPLAGQGRISIYNTLNCDVIVEGEDLGSVTIASGGELSWIVKVKNCKNFTYTITSECCNYSSKQLIGCEENDYSYFFQNCSLIGVKVGDEGGFDAGLARFR